MTGFSEQSVESCAQVKSLLLDHLRTIQTTECPSPVGQAINANTGKRIILPCRRWTCPECGENNVHRLKVRYQFGDLQPGAFLTLTQQVDDETPIMAAWNRFVTSMRRNGWEIRYFLVREYTRRGKAHLHVLVEGWWEYTETSRLWLLATGGRSKITNIRRIYNAGQAVNYVLKYMTKTLRSYYEKGERRYTCSRGVLAPNIRSVDSWHVYIYTAGRGSVMTDGRRVWVDHYQDWLDRAMRPFKKILSSLPDEQKLLYPVAVNPDTWIRWLSRS